MIFNLSITQNRSSVRYYDVMDLPRLDRGIDRAIGSNAMNRAMARSIRSMTIPASGEGSNERKAPRSQPLRTERTSRTEPAA